jgi:hypothetical protein
MTPLSDDMTDKEKDALRVELEQLATDELVSMLRNRDEEEWRSEAFAIAELILRTRGVSPEEVAAMGPEGTDVIESEPTVTVATSFFPAEAHAARMALKDAGIPAWLMDEEGGTMFGVGIGTRVQVRRKDAEAAREILSSAPPSAVQLPPELAEPPCPTCGSENVSSEARIAPQSPDEPKRGPGVRKWCYVCADCGNAWPAT